MEKVLSVVHTVLLLDGVLDAIHAVALAGGRSRRPLLYAHRRRSVVRTSPGVRETGRVAVEEEDYLLKAGLELGVDESVNDGIDGRMTEEQPVKGYLEGWVDGRGHVVRSDVEEDVEGSTPDRQDTDQETDNHRQHCHGRSYLLSVNSTLQRRDNLKLIS